MRTRNNWQVCAGEDRLMWFDVAKAYEISQGGEVLTGSPTVTITSGDATGITLGAASISGSLVRFRVTLTDAVAMGDRTITATVATDAGPARLEPYTHLRVGRWLADETHTLKIGEKRDFATSFSKMPELVAGATLASVTSFNVYDTNYTLAESDLTIGAPRVADDQVTGEVSVCAAAMIDAAAVAAANVGTRYIRAKVLTSDGFTLVEYAKLLIVA